MFRNIWLKELREQLYTWKGTLWLVISSLVFSLISYLLLTDKELSLLDQTEMMWMLAKVIIGIGLLIISIVASSIISNEFEKETAESLFLSPIKMKDFVLGKLLASLTMWFFIFIVSIPYILVTSAGTKLFFPFLAYIFLLGTIGVLGFIMLIFAISLLFRSSKNTLTTSLIVLLAFAIPSLFSTTLKNNSFALALSKANPIDNIFSSLDNVLVDYQTSLLQNAQFIFPLVLFCLITLIFLVYASKRFKRAGVVKHE
ncbi:MAG: ABC transporter permease subunit [Candidatus Omnitrophica bacterium]|nr:ABC transporter permease subunit [Candidatus Omnitrophota bacterium]